MPEGDVSIGSLIALGASGGLVPCPSGLVLLLSSIAIGRVALARTLAERGLALPSTKSPQLEARLLRALVVAEAETGTGEAMGAPALLSDPESLQELQHDLLDSARQAVKKVFVLSRVTIGADVAVTSLVLRKLEAAFPNAERVVFGARALEALVAGAPRLRVVEAPYDRRGGLLGRVNGWVRLVEAVDRERQGLSPHECAIVDPDSRLTQLGLLPVVEENVASFFFESRAFSRPGVATLGQLTATWLSEVFGNGEALYPSVWLRASDLATAEAVVPRLRSGERPVVAVNLGVGDNPRKRIAASGLVRRL